MTTVTRYTVESPDGDVIASGLSVTEAAHEVLAYDGHTYEVRATGERAGGERQFAAYVSAGSANGPGGAGRLSMAPDTLVWAADADAAWPLIAAKVCDLAGGKWDRGPCVLTDARWAEIRAEMATDAA